MIRYEDVSFARKVAAEAGVPLLTLRQLEMLYALSRVQHMTTRGLAACLGVTRPTITRGTQTLAKANLLLNRPDPSDGRSRLIALLPAGRDVVAQLSQPMARAA